MNVRLHAIRALGFHNGLEPLWVIAAFVMRLLPGELQKRLYASLR